MVFIKWKRVEIFHPLRVRGGYKYVDILRIVKAVPLAILFVIFLLDLVLPHAVGFVEIGATP